jgi:hypothetical protein
MLSCGNGGTAIAHVLQQRCAIEADVLQREGEFAAGLSAAATAVAHVCTVDAERDGSSHWTRVVSGALHTADKSEKNTNRKREKHHHAFNQQESERSKAKRQLRAQHSQIERERSCPELANRPTEGEQ